VTRQIRRHWPKTRICWRGDSHYARPEAMVWCEENGVDYVFGLAGNDVLHAQTRIVADDLCVGRAEGEQEKRRTWTEFRARRAKPRKAGALRPLHKQLSVSLRMSPKPR
jgi:hypothetical protein